MQDKKAESKEASNTDENDISDESEEVVYVIKADTVEKRVVTTGIQDINHFEILTGLKEGEQVVSGPNTAISITLRSGKKIKIVRKDQLFENK